MEDDGPPKRRYTAVKGYFLQGDDETDASSFDYAARNLGLKRLSKDGTASDDWAVLSTDAALLNDTGKAKGLSYKLIYAGRHGQGQHNVAEDRYGTAAWDDHWSLLDGDGELFWSDPHLTDLGVEQARRANAFWRECMLDSRMPVPQTYYCSPLYRCMSTCDITFAGQDLEQRNPYAPIVKELAREVNGMHTCDRRSTKSALQESWPHFRFEDGFAEGDELWRSDHRETDEEVDARIQALLDDIFENDGNSFISITTHSGAIQSLLRVTGHRPFFLQTGGVIALLVCRDSNA